MVTIKDVAKRAGVSVATVSRIINDLPGYSEETKELVENVIEELGYKPNAVARGLVKRTTKTIGVLLPDVSLLFFSGVLAGIEEQAHKLGYTIMICKTNNRTGDYIQTLYEKRVDGIIMVAVKITPEDYKQIEEIDVPLMLVGTETTYPIRYIKVDDYQASYDATLYLLNNGHRRIGMIAGTKRDVTATHPRVQGFTAALMEEGIRVSREMLTYGDYHFKSGIEGMAYLLKHNPRITAVFCASDEMATGALSYLYKRGIKVPEQISIIGFDNTSTAEKAIPPLTTVAQPLYDMGRTSVELLMDSSKKSNIIYPHHIIERDSVQSVK